MTDSPDAIVLFSGGLDSILAAKLLESQNVAVRCLHFTSPFFGDAAAVAGWRELYGLDIRSLDVSEDFAALLRRRPVYGFGKVMNPCVDCKILLLRHARQYMEAVGGRVLATGEVLGQRPMSQRRDTLHVIMRDAGVSDLLLRPALRATSASHPGRDGRPRRSFAPPGHFRARARGATGACRAFRPPENSHPRRRLPSHRTGKRAALLARAQSPQPTRS